MIGDHCREYLTCWYNWLCQNREIHGCIPVLHCVMMLSLSDCIEADTDARPLTKVPAAHIGYHYQEHVCRCGRQEVGYTGQCLHGRGYRAGLHHCWYVWVYLSPLVLTSLHQKVLLHPPPLFPSSTPSVVSLFPCVNVFFHIISSCESSLSPSTLPSCAWSYRLSRWAYSPSADWGTSWWQLYLNKICQGELILMSFNHCTAEGTRVIG